MRVSKPPHQRRQELIAAARRLFDQKGISRTRVSDIVREVGVAQGVFYYYFRSKEDLVREVVALVGDEMSARAQAVLDNPALAFPQKLAAFIDLLLDLVDQFLGDDETALTGWNGAGEDGGNASLAAECAGRLVACLKLLVERGAADGDITVRYPWETVQVLLGGFYALAARELPARELIDAVTERALGLPSGSLASGSAGEEKP